MGHDLEWNANSLHPAEDAVMARSVSMKMADSKGLQKAKDHSVPQSLQMSN